VEFRLSQLTDHIPSSLLDKLIPKKLFSQLDIASKMLLGYLVLVILTMVVVIYALISLQNLNSLNTSIVTIDVPVQEASDKMQESLLAQDTYEKRFLIFNDNERRTLFLKRGEEFREWLKRLHKLPDHRHLPLAKLTKLYQEYSDTFSKEVKLMKAGNRDGAARLSNGPMKKNFERIRDMLQDMSDEAIIARDKKMKRISDSGKLAFLITALLSVLSILFGLLGSVVVTHHISSSINKLSVATVQIANAIALEATLSFLGLGLPPTEPSLGLLIANGFQYMLSGRYWISIYPGIALVALIVAVNLVGDQIRDQFNPRLKR